MQRPFPNQSLVTELSPSGNDIRKTKLNKNLIPYTNKTTREKKTAQVKQNNLLWTSNHTKED